MASILGNCSYANSEITKLYITKWSTSIVPYFSTDGSIISGYTGLSESWDEIVLNTAQVSYLQTLTPLGPNGITYVETVNLIFPNSDSDKWAELTTLLKDRYVIIFQDANGNWFTLGWRFGTRVQAYTLQDNEYSLSFINNTSTNLLTSIDESYVNSYVKI